MEEDKLGLWIHIQYEIDNRPRECDGIYSTDDVKIKALIDNLREPCRQEYDRPCLEHGAAHH